MVKHLVLSINNAQKAAAYALAFTTASLEKNLVKYHKILSSKANPLKTDETPKKLQR